jgi:hypothetical protein
MDGSGSGASRRGTIGVARFMRGGEGYLGPENRLNCVF